MTILLNIVIAARGGHNAKSRLAPDLRADMRGKIVCAMLEDMLQTLRCFAPRVATYLVTPTPELSEIAVGYQATPIREPFAQGLNAAFASAREALRGDGLPVAFLPADLPLLGADDVRALVAWSQFAPAPVLVPASSGGGTGAILVPSGTNLPFCFGVDSLARHAAAAERLGLRPVIAARPGLGRDIDCMADLLALVAERRQCKTAKLFESWLDQTDKFDGKAA